MRIFIALDLSLSHVRELLHGRTHVLDVAPGLILRATPFLGVVASREEGQRFLVVLLRVLVRGLLVYEA